MKEILFLSILMVGVLCEDEHTQLIVGPLLSAYPCADTREILVLFEAGHEQKHNNKYYVYVKKTLSAQSVMRVAFDSMVNITLTIHTDQYARMTLGSGYAFKLYSYTPEGSIGFLVEGTEPGVTPYLTSCTVDDVELCNNERSGYLAEYATRTEIKRLGQCGSRSIDHSELIVNGAPSKPGDWPWHAALYRLDGRNLKYICGGTLISKVLVLTAAHCVTYRGSKYPPELFSVVLGKYTLYGDDKESEEKQVQQVIVHEHYNYRHLFNDIALLKLRTEVVYNDFIIPACLLRPDDKSKLNTNLLTGTIVGWGFDSSDNLSNVLQQATMPMVSELTCMRSNGFFYGNALNENSFCAGYHNGTSACNGDSGSAFQVFIPHDLPDNGKNVSGTYHVKGIVSNTLARSDAPICDPEEYVVFTDVEMFLDWIDQYLEQ
ncbi:chymotrypsin-C [Bicyclus anynana]|uniref:Chymotrypsin-C n=1 Tax=Bicyclus anynana TaxID=110368 RepID=A0ABM3LUN0_BICAN|nr:chymotrypsin-C [Bicyclus anynana]